MDIDELQAEVEKQESAVEQLKMRVSLEERLRKAKEAEKRLTPPSKVGKVFLAIGGVTNSLLDGVAREMARKKRRRDR